jgi:hypothetical protein
MNFWQNVQTTTGVTQSQYLVWLVILFLAAAALLYSYVPLERTRRH